MTEKIIKVYLCDVCSNEGEGETNLMYVDTPYLPHIHKKKLCKVCNACVKQVQEFNPHEKDDDKSWFI